MRWSLNLGLVGGTAIRIHVTFLLFLIWLGAIYYRQGGAEAAWQGTIFIVLLFLCVLLHELGHVFAAQYYGVPTRDVTLWPFGGIASMERMPDKPSQELVVALAGPAVNMVIAAGLLLWLGPRLDPANLTQIENPAVSMVAKVAGANIILVLFNMIPAFPMDGGRVLRAVLAMWMGNARATELAATIGQGFAVVFGILGILYHYTLRCGLTVVAWSIANLSCELFGLMYPRHYVRLRYEDLVHSPAEALRTLFERVLRDVRWSFVEASARDNRHQLYGNSVRRKQLAIEDVKEDLKWKSEMPPEYSRVILALSSLLRWRYGY